MVDPNLKSDTLEQPACVTALEPSAREDLFTETPSLCKWKKMARDIILIDSPMQQTMLTKRTRDQDKASQSELPKKWIQVSKFEEHDISMVKAAQQPRQSK